MRVRQRDSYKIHEKLIDTSGRVDMFKKRYGLDK